VARAGQRRAIRPLSRSVAAAHRRDEALIQRP
jgi:hypothetical protein